MLFEADYAKNYASIMYQCLFIRSGKFFFSAKTVSSVDMVRGVVFRSYLQHAGCKKRMHSAGRKKKCTRAAAATQAMHTVIAEIFVRDLISYISYFLRKVRNLVAYEKHSRIQVYLTPRSLYEN